jgi:hypothetical protein
VLGILGLVLLLCFFGPLFAIPSVICGHMALSRVKRSNGTLGGHGIALAGLITGYVGISLAILMIPLYAAIAIPNFVKARETARRNTCINNLRIIDGAKQQWALDNNKTADDVPTSQDLDKYIPGGFNSLHCPVGGVYTINKDSVPPTCSVPGHQLPGGSPAQ